MYFSRGSCILGLHKTSCKETFLGVTLSPSLLPLCWRTLKYSFVKLQKCFLDDGLLLTFQPHEYELLGDIFHLTLSRLPIDCVWWNVQFELFGKTEKDRKINSYSDFFHAAQNQTLSCRASVCRVCRYLAVIRVEICYY